MITKLTLHNYPFDSDPENDPAEDRNDLGGIRTGFKALDEQYGGLRNGHLILLGGRPAMGKTTLACSIILNLCKDSYKCMLFAPDQSEISILNRLITIHSAIPPYHTDWNNNDLKKRTASTTVILSYNLQIDCHTISIDDIVHKCKRYKPQLIVIDYLQLIRTDCYKRRKKDIKHILKQLKKLALMCCCPVLAVSSLSRQAECRISQEPIPEDLLNADNGLKYTDEIIFLYRERIEHPETAYLKIAKHTEQPAGIINLSFNPAYMSFTDFQI